MSQENVEIVFRQLVDGISNRDLAVLQAISDPEIEYTSRFTAVEGKTYRGHAGWSDYLADLNGAWEDFRLTIEELVPAGGQKLMAVGRVNAVARGSSVPIDQRVYAAWEFRDNKAVRAQTCASREEALEAVGLWDQAMSQENAEVVRRFIEAVERAQGGADWQPVLAELDPEVEIDDLDISLDTEHYRGHDKVRKWLGVWNDAWESWRVEDLEVRPVGEDRVIALFLMLVKGKGSGIELCRRDAVVCSLRAGKIVEIGYYNDQQQALEAVGLSE